jgi:Na+-transporting methylmalonyl-CoA/oxaloacetate decarboxylase beta subunit
MKLVPKICYRCLCDVTLSVYPHRAVLKNMPGHGGIYTLRVTSHKHIIHLSTLYQHSKYAIDSSIFNIMIFVCVGVMYSGEYDVCDVTLD